MMPIRKNWSRATKKHISRNVPEKGGVYELRAFGELVYIGKADRNLKSRLLDHVRSRNPNYYRFQTAGLLQRPSKMERQHLTRYDSSKEAMPPWNQRDPR